MNWVIFWWRGIGITYINIEGGRRRKENWIIKREVRVRVGARGGGRHIVDFAVRLTDHRVRLNDRHSPAHTICYWSTHAVLAFTHNTSHQTALRQKLYCDKPVFYTEFTFSQALCQLSVHQLCHLYSRISNNYFKLVWESKTSHGRYHILFMLDDHLALGFWYLNSE